MSYDSAAKPQTPDEAYDELVRLWREPASGTGPRVAQGMPYAEQKRSGSARSRLPLLVTALALAAVWALTWLPRSG